MEYPKKIIITFMYYVHAQVLGRVEWKQAWDRGIPWVPSPGVYFKGQWCEGCSLWCDSWMPGFLLNTGASPAQSPWCAPAFRELCWGSSIFIIFHHHLPSLNKIAIMNTSVRLPVRQLHLFPLIWNTTSKSVLDDSEHLKLFQFLEWER